MVLIRFTFCLLGLYSIKAEFYSANKDRHSVKYTGTIHKTTAPSLISCSIKCRVTDATTSAVFEKDVCKCLKIANKDEGNSQEITLSGTFLQIKPPRWNRIVITNEETPLTKNNLQKTIQKMTKQFVLSLDVKPTVLPTKQDASQYRSILQMTIDGHLVSSGSRIPSILFWGSSLHIYITVNSKGNQAKFVGYIGRVNQWMNIKLSQLVDEYGTYHYRIEVDGKVYHSIINNSPTEFFNVKCYLTNPWEIPLQGFVRNVWLDVFE